MKGGAGIAGVMLAGGRSSRFAGGSKEYAVLLGRPLIAHAIERSRPQVENLAISRAETASGEELGLTVLADRYKDRGPLAGLHAGLVWAASLAPRISQLATFACDTPFFPLDLVARLGAALGESGAQAAVAACGGVVHPTFGLWSVDLEHLARERLEANYRSLKGFAEAAGAKTVDFSGEGEAAFFNVNTAGDLDRLTGMVAPGA